MRHSLYILTLLGLLVACRQKTDSQTATTAPDTVVVDDDTLESSPDNFVIIPGKQVGSVTASSTEASLRKLLGDENVTRDTVYLTEGQTAIGTTLFKGTPDQAQIIWKDAKTFSRPDLILLRPASDRPGTAGLRTQWMLANGLKPGSTLKEVEQINRRAFTLYGFEWDMGGWVSNWQGGALNPKGQPATVGVRFQPGTDNPTASKLTEKVMGDAEFSSKDPVMQQINPTVSQMTLRF